VLAAPPLDPHSSPRYRSPTVAHHSHDLHLSSRNHSYDLHLSSRNHSHDLHLSSRNHSHDLHLSSRNHSHDLHATTHTTCTSSPHNLLPPLPNVTSVLMCASAPPPQLLPSPRRPRLASSAQRARCASGWCSRASRTTSPLVSAARERRLVRDTACSALPVKV
jgi:hypothetical protein